MRYYIDGYNLLFRMFDSMFDSTGDFKEQRNKIIQDLSIKGRLLGLDLVLIFDSQYQQTESSRTHVKCLEICFSAHGETADEFILNEVKEWGGAGESIVVTSDKKLAWFVRRCSAKTESVEVFVGWLNKRYRKRLRQIKEAKLISPEQKFPKQKVLKEIKSPAPENSPQPLSKEKTVEECFEYYLESFQKELDTQKEKVELKNEAVLKMARKRRSVIKRESNKTLSDMERWLKAFGDNGA